MPHLFAGHWMFCPHAEERLLLEERLPATPASLRSVRRRVLEAAQRLQARDEPAWELALAVTEAYSNALLHGTARANDTVLLRITHRQQRLVVQLWYPGEPFALSTPSLPPPEQTTGRGRYLMERLTDGVQYVFHDHLTEVRLEKELGS